MYIKIFMATLSLIGGGKKGNQIIFNIWEISHGKLYNKILEAIKKIMRQKRIESHGECSPYIR